MSQHPVKASAQIQAQGLALIHAFFQHARSSGGDAGIERLARLDRVAPVLRYMEAHLAESPRKVDLARVLHLSETRFHEVFLEALGTPPMKYLQGMRIKRAQSMLWHSAQPVAAIGRACGFSDPFHFSRTFKASTGESPRACRARARRPLHGEM